jgi:uncharacterized protein YyaL (SSP411 family)
MEEAPSAVLNFLGALQEDIDGPPEIALVGKPGDAELERMLRVVRGRFLPGAVVARGEPGVAPGVVKLLEGKEARDGRAMAYVCRGFACRQPVGTAQELERELG